MLVHSQCDLFSLPVILLTFTPLGPTLLLCTLAFRVIKNFLFLLLNYYDFSFLHLYPTSFCCDFSALQGVLPEICNVPFPTSIMQLFFLRKCLPKTISVVNPSATITFVSIKLFHLQNHLHFCSATICSGDSYTPVTLCIVTSCSSSCFFFMLSQIFILRGVTPAPVSTITLTILLCLRIHKHGSLIQYCQAT